jgi:DNA-binding response OmpR family regulator
MPDQKTSQTLPPPPTPVRTRRKHTPRAATISTPNPAAGAAARILLVDDDPGVRESLTCVLTTEGYAVIPAASALEAEALQLRETMDLAILDLNLPDKSGWDLFASLTRTDPLIPVIVITGRSGQMFTSLAAGVGALMEKPTDIPRLIEIIHDLLRETSAERLERLIGLRVRFRYVSGTELSDRANGDQVTSIRRRR